MVKVVKDFRLTYDGNIFRRKGLAWRAVAARESETRRCCQCSEGACNLALAAVYDNVVAWLRDKTCSSM